MIHSTGLYTPRGRDIVRRALVVAYGLSAGAAAAVDNINFADMSLEELGDIQVTSVSKKPERLANAAGSVFVITADDIRRSGATSLPEALRLAPNLNVAQTSASGYAITARGSNGSTTSAPNKLLVLIDGRSVYTPLFSGVFWDVQDVMLEDVERIEVSSGPGGTLWGINAVNGVINVITRPTERTRDGLLAAYAGSRNAGATFRYGAAAGDSGNYRVYGKYAEFDHLEAADGHPVDDGWHKTQLGFRADWQRAGERYSVQGNAYSGRFGQPAPGSISVEGSPLSLGTIEASGVNLTGHWEHELASGASFSVQAYYDRTERTIPPTMDEVLDLVDVQFQHSLLPMGRHVLTWGANFRYGRDRVENTSDVFAFLPAHVNQNWSSLFAQDEISIHDDLRLIAGARVERNPYTGSEVLPNLRLAFRLAPDHLLWGAVSRAVRGPSRLDADSHIPGVPPYLLDGGPDVRSEVAYVAELGYRGQPMPLLSWSVTAFHAAYDHLRTFELAAPGTYVVFANEMEGRTSGIEAWGAYQALPQWRLSAGYTALDDSLRLKPGSFDADAPTAVGKNPAHTWQVRSALDIAANGTLDIAVRHVAALSAPAVPAYTALDARLAWLLRPNLELSLTAANLLDAEHGEYGPVATRSGIPRTVYAQLLLQL